MLLARKACGCVLQNSSKWAAGTHILASRLSGCSDPCPQEKYMTVKCKVALITGGNGGIGLAIADALLECGLRKAFICGTNCEKSLRALAYLEKRHGAGCAECAVLDVTNHKQFEDVFKETIHKEGSIDILVNNAGILQDRSWEKQIDINVKGVFRGILLANKYMTRQKNKGGCVVNVASILGFDPFPYAPGYTSTKHAVVGITKSFGAQFSKNNIRLVGLCPGVTTTPLVEDVSAELLQPEWGKKAQKILQTLKSQKPAAVGKGTVYMVEYGPPGSLWVIEDNKLQRVIPPNRKSYQKLVMDL